MAFYNMRFLGMTLLLFIAIYTNGFAQDTTKIRLNAEAIAKAIVDHDLKTVVQYTHPMVVNLVGGPDKMIDLMTKEFETMKAQGVTFVAGEIGKPGQIFITKTALYSVVPQKVIMAANGTKFYSDSFLLAISLNNGDSWYFVDGSNLTDAQIKQVFPEIYSKIVIPKKSEPKAMPN
jgi:hypothetical protein